MKLIQLNVQGMLCPWPVLKARKRLETMKQGDILILSVTDPAARIDVPHFCQETGHLLLEETEAGNVIIFRIRKAGQKAWQ